MDKNDIIFLFILAAFVGYYMCKTSSTDSFEGFGVTDDIRAAVRAEYNADVDAIRNLSQVANELKAGGITVPGKLTVNGGDNNVPMVVQSNTDSHILLRTQNNDNKDSYLINRNGHFRVYMTGVGDQFGVNHDGHLYNEHTGDHVVHHIGRGENPFITLSRAGQFGNSSWYMQNINNGNPANSIFRIGKHDVGPKLDIWSDGYLNAAGANFYGNITAGGSITSQGMNIVNEIIAIKAQLARRFPNENTVTLGPVYDISGGDDVNSDLSFTNKKDGERSNAIMGRPPYYGKIWKHT